MKAIHNITAVTMDSNRRILSDAILIFEDGIFTTVDKAAAVDVPSDCDFIDGKGSIVMPGLIDTHAHADQSLLRGLGDGMHWMSFLDDVIDPWLIKREPEDAVIANQLSMIEMLKNGTTCFVSPNVDPRDDFEALTESIGDLGIRAVLGRFAMASENFSKMLAVMDNWHGTQAGLVAMWFGLDIPRRPGDKEYPDFYRAIKRESENLGVGIVYHFCSEAEDAAFMENHYGQRPAEWSRDNHALGENVLLINGCQVTPLEIDIIRDSGSHLTHSPVANMKMATGILPVPDVLAAGVNLGIGTDGALNNNGYDMFAEMKTACLLQNSSRHNASALMPEIALEMATVNGAAAIGRNDLGVLAPGKRADFILIDVNKLPLHNLVSNLVFAINGNHVTDVYIEGRPVVSGSKVTGLDEDSVYTKARDRAETIRQLFRLPANTHWRMQ